ncbi:MAG: LysE family translocator [Actinomycetota bacterium]
MLDVFGVGLIAGLALAIPLGPMAIMLLGVTVSKGWRHGVAAGAGMAIVDFSYALGVYFLGAVVLSVLGDWRWVLSVIGPLILIVIGCVILIRNFKEIKDHHELKSKEFNSKSIIQTLGIFIAATAINPPTALYFLAITPAVVSIGNHSAISGFSFAFGVLIGSGVWQQVLALGGAGVRKLATPKIRAQIGIAGGTLVILLALVLLVGEIF